MKERLKTQLVSLQIPPVLVQAVDALASRQFKTRSEFVRQALIRELERRGVCPLQAA